MPVTLQNPYAQESGKEYVWLKGNLHTHTTLSDGSRLPQTVLDLYAGLKHDFLAVTDHDIYADFTGMDAKGLILIHGNEVTAQGPHVLQVGGNRRIEPSPDRQKVIDEINAAGGLAVLNHPNWEHHWNHYSFDLMQKLTGYVGVEVFNGVCLDLEGSHDGLDKWERLLASGRMVWAFANDDSHHAGHEGRGWNVVHVPKDKANAEGIIAALRAGNFYASTGALIDTIEVNGPVLTIGGAGVQAIEIYEEKGRRLAHANASELRFDASNVNSYFIRAQVYGQGHAIAWTQPFILKGGPADKRRELDQKFSNPDAPRPVMEALRVTSIAPPGTESNEGLWRKAPASSAFYDSRTGEPPEVKTEVRVLVSAQHLAFRIDCEEPVMEKMRTRITEDGNPSLWSDDCVEIFLDVEGGRERYYQMIVNPLGAFFATHGAGWGKSLRYEARAVKASARWTVEIRLELASLAPGISLAPGTELPLHISRNRAAAGRAYVWSWVGGLNHTPSRYGTLQL